MFKAGFTDGWLNSIVANLQRRRIPLESVVLAIVVAERGDSVSEYFTDAIFYDDLDRRSHRRVHVCTTFSPAGIVAGVEQSSRARGDYVLSHREGRAEFFEDLKAGGVTSNKWPGIALAQIERREDAYRFKVFYYLTFDLIMRTSRSDGLAHFFHTLCWHAGESVAVDGEEISIPSLRMRLYQEYLGERISLWLRAVPIIRDIVKTGDTLAD